MAGITPMRKNGKNWHSRSSAFRPTAGNKSYARRALESSQNRAIKEHEANLKAEKEAERQRRITAIKDKRERKEEKERWAKMEQKMHAKKIERRKRKEKRNRLLRS